MDFTLIRLIYLPSALTMHAQLLGNKQNANMREAIHSRMKEDGPIRA